jgi:DNA invertase Pin-like site-specific DNA recombinase
MLIGYGRVSTTNREDDLEALEQDLRAAGCEKLFIDKVSSVGRRRQLEAVFESVREGDIVAATRLDRLAKSLADLLTIVARLEAKKVVLRVLTMPGCPPLDTGTAIGTLTLAVIGAVGEFEREMMLERQREATAKTRRERKSKGRPPTAQRHAAEIKRLDNEGMKPSDIATRLGIGRSSVYRVLAEETGNGGVAA